MLISLFACHVKDLQSDEQVRSIAHLLVSVSGIVFIRGDRPDPCLAILGNLKFIVLLFVGIVLENFQRRGFKRIGELLK